MGTKRKDKRYPGSDMDTHQKMLLETDKRLHYEPSETDEVLQLHVVQQDVRITNSTTMVVALPPVREARSLSYTIKALNTGNAVTLTDYPNASFSDSTSWGGPYTLNTADDNITLRSTGSSWTVVRNNIAI